MINVSFAREYVDEATDVPRSKNRMSVSNVAWKRNISVECNYCCPDNLNTATVHVDTESESLLCNHYL